MNRIPRLFIILPAMATLVMAIMGGLIRLKWEIPVDEINWMSFHGPLLISGFLGTLICLERAVGIGKIWAYVSPTLCAAGSIWFLTGFLGPTPRILWIAGSLGLALLYLYILIRQYTRHHFVMGLGALCWFAGNLLWYFGLDVDLVVFFWASFPILTIAGERLELTRYLMLSESAYRLFFATVALGIGALVAGSLPYGDGHSLHLRFLGAGYVALAAWLLRFDIARLNLRKEGFHRFLGLALISGYIWLGLAGILLVLHTEWGPGFYYDAVLHSIFIGFVMSMIVAHAPIIFSGVMQIQAGFHRRFYAHLLLLHASLLIRVCGDLLELFPLRQWGGLLNAIAVLLFLLNTISSLRFRRASSAE